MVFIYTLKDPITKKYMYVGKSVNPEKRFKQHLYHLHTNLLLNYYII